MFKFFKNLKHTHTIHHNYYESSSHNPRYNIIVWKVIVTTEGQFYHITPHYDFNYLYLVLINQNSM